MIKPTTLLLIDNQEYVSSNCYQHQLFKSIASASQLTHVNLQDIKRSVQQRQKIDFSRFNRVISTLKLRSIYNNLETLAEFLDDTSVVIYEQDVWESWIDSASYKGSYAKIAENLNVAFFAVTTRWWADFVKSKSLPAKSVRMGILPEYCVNRTLWNNKTIEVGFKGLMHHHRQNLIDDLRKLNVNVTVSNSSNLTYKDYLHFVSNMKIYLHAEDARWTVDNVPVSMGHGLWVKDIEVAAQGTFAIRNYDDEYVHYVADIPLVKLYRDVTEVPDIVNSILTMNSDDRDEMIVKSVDTIKLRNDWAETAKILIYG